jgi:hypothetical protein
MAIPKHAQIGFYKEVVSNINNILQVQRDEYATPLLTAFLDKTVPFPGGVYQEIPQDVVTQTRGRVATTHMNSLSTEVPRITTSRFNIGVGLISYEDSFNDFNIAQLASLGSEAAKYPLDTKPMSYTVASGVNTQMIDVFYKMLSTDTVNGEPTGIYGIKELIPTSNSGTKYGISLSSASYLRNSIYNTNTEKSANLTATNAEEIFREATRRQMRKRGRNNMAGKQDYVWYLCSKFFDIFTASNYAKSTQNTLMNPNGISINVDTAHIDGIKVVEDKYLPDLTAYLVPIKTLDYCSGYYGFSKDSFNPESIKNGSAEIIYEPYIEMDAEMKGTDGSKARQKLMTKGWLEKIKTPHLGDYKWNMKYTTALQFKTLNAEAFMVLTSNA